jgi:hypothetical protein
VMLAEPKDEPKEASSGDSSESEFEHVWTTLLTLWTKSRGLLGSKSTTWEPVVIVPIPALTFPPMILCTL